MPLLLHANVSGTTFQDVGMMTRLISKRQHHFTESVPRSVTVSAIFARV